MKLETPIRALVRRRAAIGDVIMSTGVVRELKKRYGDNIRIDVATDFMEVYRNNPHIENIFPCTLMPPVAEYDIYIDLDDAYELNPTLHYVDNYFYRAFGTSDVFDKSVELFPNDDDRDLVDQDLIDIGERFIAIHIRNWHWGAKNISMETWYEIFERVFSARTDFKVVCVGGPTDTVVDGHPLFVDARAKYNVQQLKYLLDHAACFVGIDSGPFQCAAASSTKIIALLTHLKPERIMPYGAGRQDVSITSLAPCQGCNDRQKRPVRQLHCEPGDYRCTRMWDIDAIATSILETL
jgi:ADP-heptose:LPS heptosyltransferase